ncbi:MAG: dipeptidase [Planctomycetota bacterium]
MQIYSTSVKNTLKLHHQSFIVDGHADTFWRIAMRTKSKHRYFRSAIADFFQNIKKAQTGTITKTHIDYQRLKDGGMNLQFMAIYTPPKFTCNSATTFALKMLFEILYAIKQSKNQINLIKSSNDLNQAIKKDSITFLISIEGGNPLNQNLSLLEVFYQLGVRAMGLTHNPHNDLGDGIGVKKPRGLTAFGKTVVKEMNRLGMIIDVAHLAKPGFNDVIKLSDSPIISSHTGVKSLIDIPRNVDDEQIKEIARCNGVIGIFYIPQYLKKFTRKKDTATVKDVVNHIEYVADKVGVDYVGLGSDFDGYGGITYGLEDISCLPNLTDELVKRGFHQTEIKKILGGNFIRVIKNILTR